MFGDRCRDSLALEPVIPIRPLHALDQSLFSKDMLRSPVRSLGDRHAVPLVSAVRHALSYQSLSYPLSGESLRDARERERCSDSPTFTDRPLWYAVSNWARISNIGLNFPLQQSIPEGAAEAESSASKTPIISAVSPDRHDREALGFCLGAKQPDDSFELRRRSRHLLSRADRVGQILGPRSCTMSSESDASFSANKGV